MAEKITCVYVCGVQMSFWDPFFSRFIAQTIVCVLWICVPVSRLERIRDIKRKRERRNKENESKKLKNETHMKRNRKTAVKFKK